MKRILCSSSLFLLLTCSLFADDLHWGGTWAGVWSGFGTSPYTAIDQTQANKVLVIFCLDYNDEIAPPYDWRANIRPVTQSNVDQYAQFGGNYPGIPATSWAFTSDPGVNGHAVNLSSSSSAYTRYLEAAWLFTNILAAQTHNDISSMIISQVAAWDLFVDASKAGDLSSRISASNGPLYTLNNYVYSADSYTSPPTTVSTSNLVFQDAVNEALNAAQNAVGQNWYNSVYAPSWDLVTGDPGFVQSFGRPVQEFLSDAPPSVPEPSSIFLLGTAVLGAGMSLRRRMQKA